MKTRFATTLTCSVKAEINVKRGRQSVCDRQLARVWIVNISRFGFQGNINYIFYDSMKL